MEGAMASRALIDEAMEVLCELAWHCGRSPRARAIPQALRPLLRKAQPPFAEGGIGQVERRGDGLDRAAGHDLPDGLGLVPAGHPRGAPGDARGHATTGS